MSDRSAGLPETVLMLSVRRRDLPAALKESMPLWTGCIAGALSETEYIDKLAAAGFEAAEIESFREYTAEDAESGGLGDKVREFGLSGADGLGIFSGVIRARKPAPTAGEAIPVVAVSADACCEPGTCC